MEHLFLLDPCTSNVFTSPWDYPFLYERFSFQILENQLSANSGCVQNECGAPATVLYGSAKISKTLRPLLLPLAHSQHLSVLTILLQSNGASGSWRRSFQLSLIVMTFVVFFILLFTVLHTDISVATHMSRRKIK